MPGDVRRLVGRRVGEARLIRGAERDRAGQRDVELGQRFGVSLRDHHDLRPGELDAVGELRCGEAPVQGRDDRAELGRGQLDLDVRGAVLAEQRDPVATPDAVCGERVGEPVHPLVQCGVRPAPVVLDQGVRAGIDPGAGAKQRAERARARLQRPGIRPEHLSVRTHHESLQPESRPDAKARQQPGAVVGLRAFPGARGRTGRLSSSKRDWGET